MLKRSRTPSSVQAGIKKRLNKRQRLALSSKPDADAVEGTEDALDEAKEVSPISEVPAPETSPSTSTVTGEAAEGEAAEGEQGEEDEGPLNRTQRRRKKRSSQAKHILRWEREQRAKKAYEARLVEEQKDPSEKVVSDTTLSSLEYLRLWESDKSTWKFRKRSQTWLLRHIFDGSQIDGAHFKLLLKYIAPLRGRSREATKESAQKVITQWKSKSSDDSAEAGTLSAPMDTGEEQPYRSPAAQAHIDKQNPPPKEFVADKRSYKRAKKVLKLLSKPVADDE